MMMMMFSLSSPAYPIGVCYTATKLMLLPALVNYLMYNCPCGVGDLRLICPSLPQIKESAARF